MKTLFDSLLRFLAVATLAHAVAIQAQRNYTTPYTFTTLAGLPPGAIDGTGSAARFRGPRGVAVDSAGNLYVADTRNHTIRKITSGGVVTTLAGTAGSQGSNDGTGSAARFGSPQGLTVDLSGNIYVADTENNAIRKITSSGVVTTLAGVNSQNGSGSSDGTGSSAQFYHPQGLAIDNAGNLYVADTWNHTIRKITSAGVVTTLAGEAGSRGNADGTGSAARFSSPAGIAVDGAGNLYVAEGNCTIRKITSGGVVTTLAGLAATAGSSDGVGTTARFNFPLGVAIDSAGNLYVADTDNQTIRKITSNGAVTTLAGIVGTYGSADGSGESAQFASPSGIAVDSSGILYVADPGNNVVRQISTGGTVTTLAGLSGSKGSADGTASTARFLFPNDVAVDSHGDVYVADLENSTIRKISPTGTVTTFAGLARAIGSADGTGSAARFYYPSAIAVDATDNLYVGDSGNDTIRKITSSGVVTTLAGQAGVSGSADGTGTAAQFSGISGVAVDRSGNVYVADSSNFTIRKITSSGVVTTLAGQAGDPGYANGTGSAARFRTLADLTVDDQGTVYVSDWGNGSIRKITADGVVTTPIHAGYADGIGTFAAVGVEIGGVAVDHTGSLYVTETLTGFTVRKISGLSVSTLAGAAFTSGSADGTGSAARFFGSRGIAIGADGKIYVADAQNHAIRVGVSVYPLITRQPTDVSTMVQTTASFTVAAGGAGTLSYQWQRQPAGQSAFSNLSNDATVSGATTATLTLTGVTGAMSGDQFRCVVSNGSGTDATSSAAVLTITTAALAPTITSASSANFTVGQSTSVTLTATGTPTPTLSVAGLPTWATFDPSSGILSGTPTGTSGSPFTVTFTAANGVSPNATQSLTLTVQPAAGAVAITMQPANHTVVVGESVSFSIAATGTPAPTYQWRVSWDRGWTWSNLLEGGTTYSGTTTATLKITGTVITMTGYLYSCIATNSGGSITSDSAKLTVTPPNLAGTYFGTFANNHGYWALRVNSDNTAVYLAHLTSRGSAVIVHLTINADGSFTTTGTETVPLSVGASAQARSLASASGTARPLATASAFALSGQISSGTITGQLTGLGETFSGTIDSTNGSAPAGFYTASALNTASGSTYAIVAPSGQALVVVASTTLDSASGTVGGNGQLTATTATGGQLALILNASAQSLAATVTPVGSITPISFAGLADTATSTTRLVNISARAFCATNNNVTIGGFVVAGSARKRVLIRAVGPTLTTQGIAATEVLADPTIEVHRNLNGTDTIIGANDNWTEAPNAADLTTTARTLGAFSLDSADTKSSALLTSLDPGVYSFIVKGRNDSAGIVLLEIYDADAATPTATFANLSARARDTTGNGVTIGGFVVTGNAPKRFLLRAVGPTLPILTANAIAVAETLADPLIELHTRVNGTDATLATIDNWTDRRSENSAAAARLGGFALDNSDTKSAAVVTTLAPGAYSFIVKGQSDTSGIVLLEIYDAD